MDTPPSDALLPTLTRLHEAATRAVERLLRGEPPTEEIALMEELARISGRGVTALPAGDETVTAARELLSATLTTLQRAETCAAAALTALAPDLDASILGRKCHRAYRAATG